MVKTIRIIAFRGTGFKYQYYIDPADDPLLVVGHVGFQFDTPAIYGFHPPASALEEKGGLRAAFDLLRQRETMAGTIQDDTYTFRRAYQLSLGRPPAMGDRLVVYTMSQNYGDQTFDHIRDTFIGWYTEERVFPYGFPPVEHDTPYDNCATIQRHLGIEIPDFEWHRGEIDLYIRLFRAHGERWTPEE